MINYINDYAIVNGIKFKRDNKTGYYLSTINIDNKRKRLHRYIWELFNGDIPKGYDIHHKDHNKDNNDISNLELLLKEQHREIHKKEITKQALENWKYNLERNARPKAIEWHKSFEGRKWHKEQYKISLGNREKQIFKCANCGKEYECLNNGINKFCSNKCKSAFRRKSGVDDVERICVKCGRTFRINKYSKKQKCNNC